jgi:hypothetical protein
LSKLESVLGHCIVRALIDEYGPSEQQFRKADGRLSQWKALKATTKVTPKASRVATFIVCWAMAMWDEGVDEFSITEYQRYWNESERQAYRIQNEFRDLWPEFDTPNELGRQLVKQFSTRLAKKEVTKLPLILEVQA